MANSYQIDFEPLGRRVQAAAGQTLLEAAQQAGLDLVAACGGLGICGTCRVRPLAGQVTPPTPSEEEQLEAHQLSAGDRLACQCSPLSDLKVEVPAESLPAPQKMQTEGRQRAVALDPAALAYDLELAPPALDDLRADWERAQRALTSGPGHPAPAITANLAALEQLSTELRRLDWKARLVLLRSPEGTHLAGAYPPGTHLLGLAVDLGSTKLALYLVGLETGITLAQMGVMNPQIAFGEDVVNRIAFANRSPENRRLLQHRVVEAIQQAAAELCQKVGPGHGPGGGVPAVTQIVELVVVGNTAMHHCFTYLPLAQLGAAPYVPAVSDPLWIEAAEVGLHFAPGARLYLPANIAGYVGGDHTAALLATRAAGRVQVLVDIGTNTEISLVVTGSGGEERIYTCSTASGPAFEGAHIHDGMRAAPGAVERVRIADPAHPQVWTVGGLAPVGICGSGILQAVAELRSAGVVDGRGALQKGAPGVRSGPRGSEYLLVPAARSGHGRDIVITRRDINEIQLAKGAIRAGIELMLRRGGLSAGQVDAWIIAGAFGTYLDLPSAMRIGMFPQQPLERFHQVGNAAGAGARQMLLSLSERAEAQRLARLATYVELTVEEDFTPEFVKAMYL